MLAYRLPSDLIGYEINRQLKAQFPDHFVMVTDDCDFDLLGFAEDGHCALWTLDELEPFLRAQWLGREKGTRFDPQHAYSEILWNGETLRCLTVPMGWSSLSFLISEKPHLGRRFFEAVCLWTTDSDRRITVYDGWFQRDKKLEESIESASWEQLVLPQPMKERLYQDVVGFFAAKESYGRFGVPWRRGVLLHGPPGNGKTHAVKSLIREVGKACLVVRSLNSLKHSRGTDENAVTRVFARARQMAPAMVLLEDIDSLAARSNLSALLNELDGLASNEGILCVATTNHLDRLDVALSNRPSRFDRKYEFRNPKVFERLQFLSARFGRLDPDIHPTKPALEQAAKGTKGFSGAMLQELVSACALRWIHAGGSMDPILGEEIAALSPGKVVASKS